MSCHCSCVWMSSCVLAFLANKWWWWWWWWYQFKEYCSRRILTKFLKQTAKSGKTGHFSKRIRETRSTDQWHESGRPKHARNWRERDRCGWTGRVTKPGKRETNTSFNTPDIERDGFNTMYSVALRSCSEVNICLPTRLLPIVLLVFLTFMFHRVV